ncbi:MAG: acyltransferase [Bacteroidales bacterium]
MIKIGYNSDQFVASNTCGLWDMHGEIRFRGKALFSPGVTINVSEDARLIIGNCVSLGAKVKVRSWHSIIIDDFTGIAEESQLFDTDFHLIRELNSGKVYNHCGEIYIGKTCWIGNRCTIAKGTRLPERTIVASNSLANRDYFTLLTKPSVIGGIPAKILRENIVRIYDSAVEEQVLTFFKNTPDSVSMNEVQRFMSLHEENTQIQHYFDSVI